MNVICFGDSNTFGSDPAKNHERHPYEARWTTRLQKLLGEGYHVIAEGMGGRTTVFDDPLLEGRNGLAILPVLLHSHRPHKSVAPVLESRVILIDHVPLGARLLAVVIAAIHATHDKDTLEILICAGSRSAVKAKTAHIETCSGGTFQIEKSSSIRRDSEAIIASALAV